MPPNQPRDLEEIPGIGAERAEALREAGFQEVADLKDATEEELMQVEMIDDVLARDIKSTVAPNNDTAQYRLTVRLDASDVEAQREKRPQDLQVVARTTDDALRTAPVEFDDSDGLAELTFEEQPGALGVYVGPEEMEPHELIKTQTLTENIPARRWDDTPEIEVDPIRIPPYYWDWWRRWCRTFTVTGKLTCPDGSPVPGAEVCAKDVDSWFVWQSTQQVGCDTTDLDGTFEIEFRWCCGFWPWWWWQHRTWRPDDHLAERIEAATRDVSELSLAKGGNRPTLNVFDDLLEDAPIPVDEPVAELDPDRLEQIRTDLGERLPRAPELRELGVWPWAPWQPWYDCRPDLIFEATQDGTVVLDQDVGDTMWDVSTSENVTLVTNEDAICGGGVCPEPPCPGGECITVSGVCDVAINNIGGNRGATTTSALEGYANPKSTIGTGATSVDRPFAGRVFLKRNFETDIDYVELEYHDGTKWTPVPRDGLSDFEIGYIHFTGGTVTFPDARFEVTEIGGRWVVPTREQYEDTHPPLWSAEADRNGPGAPPANADWWGSHQNRLFAIDSTYFSNNIGDGTYRFRLQGYKDVAPSDDEVELEDLGPVKRCFDEEDDQDDPADPVEVVLTFDNRTKVNVHSHPHKTSPAGSGSGTVHKPYVEPDTSIEAVRLTDADGNPIDVPVDEEGECPSVEKTDDADYLEVDFIARDPVSGDNPVGHLSHYTLHATYGRSNIRNLLKQPSCEIDPQVPGSAYTGYKDTASPPDSKGTYGRAVDQGASRPGWEGGEYTLRMKVDEAFPKDCCYQLVLKARKRTIANCNSHWPHRNRSEYSIGYGI